MWTTPALPGEETNISKAVEKRKREFRAGRHCAHQALTQLLGNAPESQRAIRIGKSRGPCWPSGVVGSISHSGEHCSAAVALSQNILSLGHDIEQARPLDTNVYNMICTQNERDFLARHQHTELPLSTLIFSAKESIHKAYSPLNDHMLDFLDAELTINLEEQTFLAHIINPKAKPAYNITEMAGRFCIDGGYIYTGIYIRPNEL